MRRTWTRAARLSSAPDTDLLLLTLLKLRHDLVIIGRAAVWPLPEALQARLDPLTQVAAAIGDFLRASGATLLARRLPPRIDSVESALDSYAAAIASIRHDGLTRRLPSEVTERFFALCFALEQMRHHFGRAPSLRGGMGAITWPDESRNGVSGRLTNIHSRLPI